ncbi:MAG: YhcH/YjgK/YiaL family protein [Angelakisella sp.]
MIYAKQQDLRQYLGLHKNLDTALRFLEQTPLESLTLGRNEIDGDDVYVSRFDYNTIPLEQGAFEAHEVYADIHLVLSGAEQLGVSHIGTLEETTRNPDSDFVGYRGDVELFCPLRKGDFAVVFPEDAHIVKLQLGGESTVQKVVFKVKM